jgi:SAM-dependent methyltransferase
MRQIAKDVVKTTVDILPIGGPILEIGSLRLPGQEDFADLRPLFPNCEYIGTDLQNGLGVISAYKLAEEFGWASVGCVVCIDTLEHVSNPSLLIDNVYEILKYDGIFILVTVFNWVIHKHPYDYWRFTSDGLLELCQRFQGVITAQVEQNNNPRTVWAMCKNNNMMIRE